MNIGCVSMSIPTNVRKINPTIENPPAIFTSVILSIIGFFVLTAGFPDKYARYAESGISLGDIEGRLRPLRSKSYPPPLPFIESA
mmetsp:Transcript_12698/g.26227  ORF Transcript_12698/g.26227 Transcript_12698/m.26227 type:complete len:85 (-) Transcript_12698:83-337(-)